MGFSCGQAGAPIRFGVCSRSDISARITAFLPTLDGLFMDDAGQLWVHDYPTGNRRGPQTWRVSDVEGRYLGSADMPGAFTPFQVTGDKVVGRWLDESDVALVGGGLSGEVEALWVHQKATWPMIAFRRSPVAGSSLANDPGRSPPCQFTHGLPVN